MVGGTGEKEAYTCIATFVHNYARHLRVKDSPSTLRVMNCWLLPAMLLPTQTHIPSSSLATDDIINEAIPTPVVNVNRGVELVGTSSPFRSQTMEGVG